MDENSIVSYYSVLGIGQDASFDDIKRAYRKLAMQWHPDKWTRTSPALLGEAKRKFQQIQEAYDVLSNQSKRTRYDAGLYDPEDDEDEGFCDFVHEMVDLMGRVKEEEKDYSMEDLQAMLKEMLEDFDPQPWFRGQSSIFQDAGGQIPSQFGPMPMAERSQLHSSGFQMHGERSQLHLSGFQMHGESTFCN